jgi:hypothetical protein
MHHVMRLTHLCAALTLIIAAACGGKQAGLDDGANPGGTQNGNCTAASHCANADGGVSGGSGSGPGTPGSPGGGGTDGGTTGPGGSKDGGTAPVACTTMCDGECVSAEDPLHGCGTCSPCSAPTNGTARCNAGACAFTCNPGFSVSGSSCTACGDTTSDVHNCGYCGHDCGTATCTNGVCETSVLASAQVDAYAIAVDEQNVYWTVEGTGKDGAVMKLALTGNAQPVALATGLYYPATLTVDATRVYFATADGIYSVPIAGGASPTALTSIDGSATGIAVDKSNVYVSITPFSPMDTGAVVSVPIGGGALTALAGVDQPRGVATSGQSVYFADTTDVFSVASGGGKTKTIEPQQYAYAIAADGAHTYWTSGLEMGAVMQAGLSGGVPLTLVNNQFYPNAVTVDSSNVYFTVGKGGGGTVVKVPIGGGAPVTLATAQAYPTSVAVNSTRVFWVNFGTGTINSVAK